MSKTGKEVKSNNFKDYSVTFGSVNNKHPKAVYINISAWAEPKCDEEINYSRAIRNLNKNVKQTLFNLFDAEINSDFLKDRTIVDLDIRESGIRYGKRSFINCELTLFLNSEIPVNSDFMKQQLTDITENIINRVFNKNDYFVFYKKKK